jgi:hypothetical protein
MLISITKLRYLSDADLFCNSRGLAGNSLGDWLPSKSESLWISNLPRIHLLKILVIGRIWTLGVYSCFVTSNHLILTCNIEPKLPSGPFDSSVMNTALGVGSWHASLKRTTCSNCQRSNFQRAPLLLKVTEFPGSWATGLLLFQYQNWE